MIVLQRYFQETLLFVSIILSNYIQQIKFSTQLLYYTLLKQSMQRTLQLRLAVCLGDPHTHIVHSQ